MRALLQALQKKASGGNGKGRHGPAAYGRANSSSNKEVIGSGWDSGSAKSSPRGGRTSPGRDSTGLRQHTSATWQQQGGNDISAHSSRAPVDEGMDVRRHPSAKRQQQGGRVSPGRLSSGDGGPRSGWSTDEDEGQQQTRSVWLGGEASLQAAAPNEVPEAFPPGPSLYVTLIYFTF